MFGWRSNGILLWDGLRAVEVLQETLLPVSPFCSLLPRPH